MKINFNFNFYGKKRIAEEVDGEIVAPNDNEDADNAWTEEGLEE